MDMLLDFPWFSGGRLTKLMRILRAPMLHCCSFGKASNAAERRQAQILAQAFKSTSLLTFLSSRGVPFRTVSVP